MSFLYKIKYKIFISIFLFVQACSSNISSYLPEKVGIQEKFKKISQADDRNALSLLYINKEQKLLLNEFSPDKISCSNYDFSGIKIIYAIARFKNVDDAFGMYSGLVFKPRERFKLGGGEISYKNPYFAGLKGEYVFWFWSPSNPATYAPFYKRSANDIFKKIKSNSNDFKLSYHWKILPKENMVVDSIVYIRSRTINGFNFQDTYSAEYQTGNVIGKIYVQKFNTEKEAIKGYEMFKSNALSKNKKLVSFENFKLNTYYWKENDGFYIVHRYKWIVFFMERVATLTQARNLMSIMYLNMQKIRGEVLKDDF